MENDYGTEQKKGETLKKEIGEWARSILLAIVLAVLIRLFFFQVTVVEGTSMFPTLKNHERLIVNKAVYYLKQPHKGEIIVFNFSPRRDFIKRVVALEGDVVEIKNGRLFVNNQSIEEPYIKNYNTMDFGPAVIPQGHAFVLGDNRNNSMDSRDPAVGYISLEQIKGKASLVFWPPFSMRLL
ncbi:MAG: signal peptidase I [Dethiobacter sp.]|jgi:signal peptidase I|nr:MAG: signal peptidase I [Dethiobacter sp.]